MSDDRFDWSAENAVIALQEQKTTAVYWNKTGSIVIRQEAGALETEDPFVVINASSVPTLIKRLQELLEAGPDH